MGIRLSVWTWNLDYFLRQKKGESNGSIQNFLFQRFKQDFALIGHTNKVKHTWNIRDIKNQILILINGIQNISYYFDRQFPKHYYDFSYVLRAILFFYLQKICSKHFIWLPTPIQMLLKRIVLIHSMETTIKLFEF